MTVSVELPIYHFLFPILYNFSIASAHDWFHLNNSYFCIILFIVRPGATHFFYAIYLHNNTEHQRAASKWLWVEYSSGTGWGHSLTSKGRLYTFCILHFASILLIFSQNTPWNRKHSLYTVCISHFASILQMFSRNTPLNTKHSLYTFRTSCKFCILLMLRKNKSRNPLTFRANANLGAKCVKCEQRKKRHETQKKCREIPLYTFCFSHFAIVFVYFAISVQPAKETMT